MTKQTAQQSANANGRHATNGRREMAPSDPGNDKALLQRLQGDLRRLAPVLEQVVGALHAMQSSIDEDKCTVVASATVWHEVKVASTLSTTQAMLAGLGAERLCSALKNANLAPPTAPGGPSGAHRQTSMRSWQGRCSIRSHAATGPSDLGSVAHDHPAPDGCEMDYGDHFFVQFWGSPPGLVPHGR